MARTYARISVKRGADEEWRNLTLAQQAVYDFLLTHPKLSVCGALDVKIGTWVRMAADVDTAALIGILGELEDLDYLAWDRDTDELVIRTFVRHDGVLQNKNLGKGMWAAWEAMESDDLRRVVVDNLPDIAFEARFEPPANALRIHHSNQRSNHRPEGRFEPPHPHPQPQPASCNLGGSDSGYEFSSDEGQAPVVSLASYPGAAT